MTPLRCIVLTDQGDDELARRAVACLASVPEIGSCSEHNPSAQAAIPDADVFIVPAVAGNLRGVLRLLARARVESPGTSILVIGAGLSREQTLEVLCAGAYDFVAAACLANELSTRTLRCAGLVHSKPQSDGGTLLDARLKGLIGNCPSFLKQMARLPVLAGCDAGVLVLGETGTGKELFAQAIHYLSPRRAQPWVPVNCSAIPIELIEAELFGHTKGAYTTAQTAREGLIASADGGTLFLDEIDSLPQAAQGKLLRFLQEREYRPVGSNTLRRANVRVVAASNRDLTQLVGNNQFRQDLYFRLNVLTVALAPLRQRREDIPMLAAYFARRFAAEFARPVPSLSPLALKRLLAHAWPGNVRELSHVIERAVLLGNGPCITAADVDIDADESQAQDDSFRAAKARAVEQFERSYIEQMLIAFDGNITHAALAAGKNRRALWELMRKHRIEAARFRSPPRKGFSKSVAA